MGQGVKVPTTRPNNPSSSPRTHMVGRTEPFPANGPLMASMSPLPEHRKIKAKIFLIKWLYCELAKLTRNLLLYLLRSVFLTGPIFNLKKMVYPPTSLSFFTWTYTTWAHLKFDQILEDQGHRINGSISQSSLFTSVLCQLHMSIAVFWGQTLASIYRTESIKINGREKR